MNANIGGVLAPVVIAGTVNGIAKYQEDGPVSTVQIVFANVALFGSLVGAGSILGWGFASALAVLYLIATMLTTGLPVLDWFGRLVSGN